MPRWLLVILVFVGGLGTVHVELVLETGAAAALHAHAQHGARGLAAQYLADPACRPFRERNIVHPRTNDCQRA